MIIHKILYFKGVHEYYVFVFAIEDLEIWQKARELCKLIYETTNTELFKKEFKFRDQIQSSAGSVMDNIAEGFERDGRKEFIQFLSVAKGSCGETRSQCYRAFDSKLIPNEKLDELLGKTIYLSKKISTLITYLKKSDIQGTKYLKPET